jgi:dihydrolipoamide dehydrogenase
MSETRVVVIGSGPGGYVAALKAARHGAATTLVEKDVIGGTCLNRGCIPAKTLLASAHALTQARSGEEYGFAVAGNITPDLNAMMDRKERVIGTLRGNVETLLKKAKVTVVRGTGRLAAASGGDVPNVVVDTDDGTVTLEADRLIIATGSEPVYLPMFDFSHPSILTSNGALEVRQIPQSMLIVGAGVIGCEFASFFSDLGTQITMVEMMPQMLPLEDNRLAKQFQQVFRKKGIQVLLKTKVESIAEYGDGYVVAKLSDGSELKAEKLLVSVGRRPNSKDIGLEEAGVEVDGRGFVIVNDYLETNIPGVYAIGDVNGGMMLAHVASHEAFVAIDNALAPEGATRRARDLRFTPSCTYTHPEVASVGLTEDQAAENGYEAVTGTYRFSALGKAIAMGEDAGYVQLIADRKTDLLLGANMMGPHVTDVIHEIGVALQAGMTVTKLGETIHAHPTLAEAVMEAAHDVHGECVHIAR